MESTNLKLLYTRNGRFLLLTPNKHLYTILLLSIKLSYIFTNMSSDFNNVAKIRSRLTFYSVCACVLYYGQKRLSPVHEFWFNPRHTIFIISFIYPSS